MREFELIDRVRGRLAEAGVDSGRRVVLGSGDDAAVVEATGTSALSVDAIVDGVHFQRKLAPPESIGRKALASALSDLAAMGGSAGEAVVVLGVPEDLGEEECDRLVGGLVDGAREWGAALVGGDVVAAPRLFLSVSVLGPLESAAAAVRRAGAAPGQVVAVTGELGGAAAGLLLIEHPELGDDLDTEIAASLRGRQLAPTPRLGAGRALARSGAAAMIDISDGLGADAGHIARQSEAKLSIDLASVPVAEGVTEVAAASGRDPLDLVAAGGEDYELLACLPPGATGRAQAAVTAAGARLTAIGEVTSGAGVELRGPEGELREPRGFDQLTGPS